MPGVALLGGVICMHFLRARRIRGGGEATGGEGGVVVQVGRNTPVLAGNPRLLCRNALKFHCGGVSQGAGCESRLPFVDPRQTAGMGRFPAAPGPGTVWEGPDISVGPAPEPVGPFSQLPAAQAGDPARNFLNPQNGGMVGRGGSVGLNHDLAIDSNPQSPGPSHGSWLSPEHPSLRGLHGVQPGNAL